MTARVHSDPTNIATDQQQARVDEGRVASGSDFASRMESARRMALTPDAHVCLVSTPSEITHAARAAILAQFRTLQHDHNATRGETGRLFCTHDAPPHKAASTNSSSSSSSSSSNTSLRSCAQTHCKSTDVFTILFTTATRDDCSAARDADVLILLSASAEEARRNAMAAHAAQEHEASTQRRVISIHVAPDQHVAINAERNSYTMKPHGGALRDVVVQHVAASIDYVCSDAVALRRFAEIFRANGGTSVLHPEYPHEERRARFFQQEVAHQLWKLELVHSAMAAAASVAPSASSHTRLTCAETMLQMHEFEASSSGEEEGDDDAWFMTELSAPDTQNSV